MIKFQEVSKTFFTRAGHKQIIALKSVSFEIKPAEFVTIVGKSGAGKTTLLKLILAEERPTRGDIFFNGDNLGKIKTAKLPRIRRKIGTVFQDYKLLPLKTAYENIAYILKAVGAEESEILRNVPEVLGIVGLASRAQNFPEELSAGERQRIAIARALIHRPKVILADEPTGNLDPYCALDIIKLLLKINEIGTTVILSTHDKEIINRLGKRVLTLEQGALIRDEERGHFIL
ncbi:MAG: cell division ATP-binding protein FtsE [Candidatus Nealsonbacteria bacterium CG08_land_8_20_14_0_20_38_20]|uniref:Cell division ATP-binding protein FtsE n=1 Tax=Candidatus Nealsonbacteria bacterium CG08_land_8_20_14_0_20_38_20 TaxID=1974705 RepID=A0A2H0YLL9_9BACT|nr:MAG: cell division ATP-binding protein FtsE [Candidatus Nealsonbacteria bacterium CG08_land_8_20_14_0_20_38_20]